MEPFSHGVTYTKESYSELYAKLPPDHQKILPKPEDIKADNITLMMADIPAGLADIIADITPIHGYDRRQGNYFLALLKKSGDTTRILFGSIPQYCGGDGHYSTANPSPATLIKAYQLDFRVAKQWLKLYNSEDKALTAKADLSLTGINFADVKRSRIRSKLSYIRGGNAPDLAFRDPVAYVTKMMLRYPGMFTGVGEITGIKEMVYQQLGKWKWRPDRAGNSRISSAWPTRPGRSSCSHNDFGNHGMSAAYRPSPAKQNYENLGGPKFVFSQPKYRQVQIVFAHTGIGRLVRPNDSPRSTNSRYIVKDWRWDEKTGKGSVYTGPGATTRTVTVSKDAPEHIHQLYDLFQAVPNARVDISWNDALSAYVELAQANPEAAKAVVQFFLDHRDRILFGSDTVKPVNEAHYNQALTTGSPLFAEIARRDPDAAFKIMRGNYDKALEVADNRVHT